MTDADGQPLTARPAGLSPEQLESLGEPLAALGVGASVVDRNLRLVWCNRLLRAEAPDVATPGNHHCFAVHWQRRSRCVDCLPVLVFQTGEVHEGYRERQRSGEPRKVYRVRAVPVRDARGAVTHVLESFVDVTDLARQAGLALFEDRLSSSLDVAGHGVYVVDPKGRIVGWSPRMEAILGRSIDCVLGRHVREICPAERWAEIEARGLGGEGTGRVETERVGKDGRLVAVVCSTTAILDPTGEVCGYQTIVEDLSEVNRLRREIELGARALAAIVHTSPDAIFSTDAALRVTAWNRGAEVLLGYSAAEASQLGLGDLLGDTALAARLFEQVKATGRHGLRQVLTRRTGAKIALEMTITALGDSSGGGGGLSVIGRDIADREHLEQQMIRSEKLAAVGSLAAGLAHEIGTPLNVISAATEYVLLDLPADHPSRTELQTVLGETERIQRLVSDLLGFARGAPPVVGHSRPKAALERVMRLLRAQMDRRRVQASTREPDHVAPVGISDDALHQVLLNVLLNALSAVEDGGRILASLRSDTLRRGGHVRAAVCFAIGDDGPGIPPERRQRVFDPFFTTRPDGTGLGLTVCNRIVTDQGGEIRVGDSSLGGALIEIFLPVADAEAGAAGAHALESA